MKKKALAILIPSLLAGGLFYTLNNTDPSRVEIAGEWSERFSAQSEAPFLSKEPQQVLGEELAGQTATEPVLTEEKRGFAGCRENQLNINLASAEDLEALVGIGQVISQKIVEERQKELFYSLDDLTRVYRIGAGTVANIKEQGIACAGSLDEGLFSLFAEEAEVFEKDKESQEEIIETEKESEEEIKEGDHKEEPEKDSEVKEEKTKEFEGCKDGQINLNSASKEDLMEISQIGSAYADQVVELRQEEPFWSVNDLDRVRGIALGGSRLEAIIEQGLACAADSGDTSFAPFKEETVPTVSVSHSLSSEPKPTVKLSYAAENPFDKEVEIAFFASGLKEAIYDVKISIENEGILSRIYNAESGEWLSSSFYLTQVFSGTSFESQFKLKIREDRSDFRGTADIIARIRESGKTGYLAEFKDTINIAESESAADNEDEEELPEQEQAFEGCSEGQININSADQETLEMIVQIGPSRAEQIIQLRQELPFYSLDDLERVSGIAEGIISQIKEQGLACAACPSQTFFIEEEPEPSEEEPEEEPEPSEEEPEPEEEAMKEFEGCKDGQININVANKDSLIEIYQIGDSRADQIIELREIELFWSIDDMVRISGIGESYVQKIREQGLACAAEPY